MDYFSEIVGQERAIFQLKKIVDHDQISHAYLFLGPSGIGKMLTAFSFARCIINRADRDAALFFKENLHPDLLVIEKQENKALIGKEQITREMEPWLALKPYRASRRVVIIRDSQLLSMEAANALLKTLEEPPDYAVIILVSDDNNLLETIVSRCQLLRFFPVSEGEVKKLLLERGFDQQTAHNAAQLGQGSISTALGFAGEEAFKDLWDIAAGIVEKAAGGQVVEVFYAAEKMERNPYLISSILVTILRDINIYQETGKEELLALPLSAELAALTGKNHLPQLVDAIGRIINLQGYYRTNVNSLIININIAYEVWQALR
ncbi:MAG: hypothetical protein ABFD08_19845 [Syntrophomonas sp.]